MSLYTGDNLLDSFFRRTGTNEGKMTDKSGKVTQDFGAVLGVNHFGVKLNAVNLAFGVQKGGAFDGGGAGHRDKSGRKLFNLVAM